MNIYLEKIAANMKNFAHVHMQNLDNTGDDHLFTARNLREVKNPPNYDPLHNRRSNIISSKSQITKDKRAISYNTSEGLKVVKSKKGYVVEVPGIQRDVAGRMAPSAYYTPASKLKAGIVFDAIQRAGQKVGRTYNPSHLSDIQKGIHHVDRRFLINRAAKIGLATTGLIGGGYLLKKHLENK
jgi:hypothetical protein